MAFNGHVVGLTLGLGGQSGSKNVSAVPVEELLIAENLTFEDAVIRKEGGAAKYNSAAITGTPKVLGGWDWNHNGSTQRSIIVTDAGKIIKDDGSGDYNGGTTLASGLTVSSTTIPVFVEGGIEAAGNARKLFIFTGTNQVQVLSGNGATTTAITTPAADWAASFPAWGLIHEGRLWGGGNGNDPHRIYYSILSDHEDMTGAGSGSISVYPGEGQRISWACSFKGLIVIAKHPHGLYAIDTTDPTSTNWKVARVSRSIGSPGPHSYAVVDDDILIMDNTANFYLISTVTEFGNIGTRSITRRSHYDVFLRDELDLSTLRNAVGVFYPAKREAHFAMTALGSTVNNRRVVVDFNREDAYRFRISTRDTPVSMWLKADSDGVDRLTTGDNAGFVWDLDQSTRSADGSGYSGKFQTPHLDFSFYDDRIGSVNKDWAFLEIVVEPKGDHNLTIDVYHDGEFHETIQFNMGGSGTALGTFTLGTHTLSSGSVLNKRHKLTGRSRRISLLGNNSGAEQDFSLSKFYFGFNVSDTELTV